MTADSSPGDRPVPLPTSGPEGALWASLLDLQDTNPPEWTLVGALMVTLHAYERGLRRWSATADADAVVEVRGVAKATERFSSKLLDLGWQLEREDMKGETIGFRFRRSQPEGRLAFDVLAPEGLGERADLTTIRPMQAMPVAGARQALSRTRPVSVALGDRHGALPRPDIVGALVMKSHAATKDSSPDRHVRDLAVLYAAVADPMTEAASLPARSRKALQAAPEPGWHALSDRGLAAAGRAARALLVAQPPR